MSCPSDFASKPACYSLDELVIALGVAWHRLATARLAVCPDEHWAEDHQACFFHGKVALQPWVHSVSDRPLPPMLQHHVHQQEVTAVFVSCETGLRPQVTSSMNTPKAKMSDAFDGLPVCPSSGARYPIVLTTCVVCGSVPRSYNLARPKLPSRQFISASNNTLLVLMSRCRTTCSQSSWRYNIYSMRCL
uniref:Uncharacterized protein n=1 Tax=Oryza glumipatula TaxID=40148 RepID=A0A0D9YT39_9ORYZ